MDSSASQRCRPPARFVFLEPWLFVARAILVIMLALAARAPAGAAGEAQLMEPDQAFQVEARMTSSEELSVTWRIADDHYMYRKAFSVQAQDGNVTLGVPDFPEARKKTDEFFGEVEIYEGSTTFTVPVSGAPEGDGSIVIRAVGQGCNEPVGVCFPPVSKTLEVSAPGSMSRVPQSTMRASAGESKAGDALEALMGGGSNRPEFLHPDEAFRYELAAMGPETVLARFSIEPGYYLYKDKLAVSSRDAAVEVKTIELPEGVEKTDEYFGEVLVFYDTVDAQVSLERPAGGPRNIYLNLAYQGCADDGICYPPIEKEVSLTLPGVSDAAAAGGFTPGGTGGGGPASMAWPVLLAFGSGILLTFTPCVLPMIPILAGILVGQGGGQRDAQGAGRGGGITRLRGGGLALVYVLGTAVTYSAIGVVAGLTGEQLQAYFQNAWAIGLLAALLTVMALAMFGLFELKVPSSIQTRLQHRATATKAGAFGGVFAMGAVSALIVGACVSPVLISVLGLAISRGDPVLGGSIMFAMAIGMGLLLIAMGFGFGHLLPKAGPWMERVKHVFGILLLAVVVWLLGALPQVPVLYLWAVLLIAAAVYLGASGAGGPRSPWTWLRQGGAAVLVAWGVLALLGGVAGNRDITRPVDAAVLLGGAGDRAAAHAEFRRVSNPETLERLMRTAREQGRPVMVDYYADWCLDCVRMAESTFSDRNVVAALQGEFMLIQVDVTDPDDAGTRAIKQAHGVFGPPAMLFFNEQGREIESMRRYGYLDSGEFLDHIAPLREG